MSSQKNNLPAGLRPGNTWKSVLLGLMYVLPLLQPGLFAWMHGLLALPVFYILQTAGPAVSRRLIVNGLLIAAAISLFLQQGSGLLFSLTLVPLGYSLHRSAALHHSPWQTGLKGFWVLSVIWALFWVTYASVNQTNPYQELLHLVDTALAQSLNLYKKNQQATPALLLQLETMIAALRLAVPKIMPCILTCMVIMTVWMNQVLAASVQRRIQPGHPAWPQYSAWQLPDRLVWLLIAGCILLMTGSGRVSNAGIWLILPVGLLYCFQGLAVFLALLDRWSLPSYLRVVLYLLLILQSYGLILLAILGLAETWVDLRKLNTRHQADE